MPKKRGTRSGLRREFRVVRATALRKRRGSRKDLSEYELQVLNQQITADLHRIDGDGAGTASGSQRSSETAHECHDGHGQEAHAGNPAKRYTAGGNERNPDGTQLREDQGWVRAGPSCSIQRFSTRCNPSTANGRRGKPSSSNGGPTSSHRTGSIESFWRKSTTPPKMFETSTWTSRTKS